MAQPTTEFDALLDSQIRSVSKSLVNSYRHGYTAGFADAAVVMQKAIERSRGKDPGEVLFGLKAALDDLPLLMLDIAFKEGGDGEPS